MQMEKLQTNYFKARLEITKKISKTFQINSLKIRTAEDMQTRANNLSLVLKKTLFEGFYS